MANDEKWTLGGDGTPIHLRSWSIGLRQGLGHGLFFGSLLGGFVATAVWMLLG